MYTQLEDVIFSVSADTPLQRVDYYVDGTYVGFGNTQPNYSFTYSSFKPTNTYQVSAIGYTNNCESIPVATSFLVSDVPKVIFDNYNNNQYIQQGNRELKLTSYSLSLGEVSAVSLSSNHGNIGSATKIGNIEWTIPFSVSAFPSYSISATAIDTLGNIGSTTLNLNVLLDPFINVTVSGSSTPTVSANSNTTFTIATSSNNNTTLEYVELYYGETKLEDCVVSGSNYITQYPTNAFGYGNKTFTIKVVDSLGAIGYKDITLTILPSTTSFTKPKIELKSSNPESRISSDSISSTFQISDYINGIIKERISVESGSLESIVEVVQNKVYEIVVVVSKSTNIVINATNFIGQSNSLLVNNYVIKCSTNRKLNLTNYLPEYLRYDTGSQLEFFEFTEFFENYLNTIYEDIDGSCNIGVLEKVNQLRNLHNIDEIKSDYLPYLSNMLDYDITLNKEELALYSNRDGYNDLDSYVNKMLRFVVSNLPNSYNIKTTRNAIKILLLSFGIVGNVIEVFSNDYKDNWVFNNYTSGSYVNDDITSDYFPTPHISIGIDLKNTPDNLVSQPSISIQRMLESVESIRPTNVVVDGVTGFIDDINLPLITANMKFVTTKVFSITKDKQLPPFKA